MVNSWAEEKASGSVKKSNNKFFSSFFIIIWFCRLQRDELPSATMACCHTHGNSSLGLTMFSHCRCQHRLVQFRLLSASTYMEVKFFLKKKEKQDPASLTAGFHCIIGRQWVTKTSYILEKRVEPVTDVSCCLRVSIFAVLTKKRETKQKPWRRQVFA